MTLPAIERLRALLEAASRGPLVVNPSETQLHIAAIEGPDNTVTRDILTWDAELFVAMHQALPALLAAAKRYYWLRDKAGEAPSGTPTVVRTLGVSERDMLFGDELDLHVDAALARKEG